MPTVDASTQTEPVKAPTTNTATQTTPPKSKHRAEELQRRQDTIDWGHTDPKTDIRARASSVPDLRKHLLDTHDGANRIGPRELFAERRSPPSPRSPTSTSPRSSRGSSLRRGSSSDAGEKKSDPVPHAASAAVDIPAERRTHQRRSSCVGGIFGTPPADSKKGHDSVGANGANATVVAQNGAPGAGAGK